MGILLTLLLIVAGFCLFLILTQDFHVFPSLLFSVFKKSKRNPKTLPPGIESIMLKTADGKSLEVWRLAGGVHNPCQAKPYVALIFHGNGGTLENFLLLQLWFSDMGISCYSFDYRGIGKSTGWPSEMNIEHDAVTLWHYILQRESVEAQQMIVLGLSIGGAPAAQLAKTFQPHTLILVAAFTSLKALLRDNYRFIHFLAPFVRFKFETLEQVKHLRETNLLIGHGQADTTVPIRHSMALEKAYTGTGVVKRLVGPRVGHNATFVELRKDLEKELEDLL